MSNHITVHSEDGKFIAHVPPHQLVLLEYSNDKLMVEISGRPLCAVSKEEYDRIKKLAGVKD